MEPRVAYVSPIVAGSESALREAHADFPRQALSTSGLASASAFIGGGYYILLLEPIAQDFQALFARFTDDPEARSFFATIQDYLTEPTPIGAHPADQFHQAPEHGRGGPTTAELPLAGEVFHVERSA